MINPPKNPASRFTAVRLSEGDQWVFKALKWIMIFPLTFGMVKIMHGTMYGNTLKKARNWKMKEWITCMYTWADRESTQIMQTCIAHFAPSHSNNPLTSYGWMMRVNKRTGNMAHEFKQSMREAEIENFLRAFVWPFQRNLFHVIQYNLPWNKTAWCELLPLDYSLTSLFDK